jgi:hypothetical protein
MPKPDGYTLMRRTVAYLGEFSARFNVHYDGRSVWNVMHFDVPNV